MVGAEPPVSARAVVPRPQDRLVVATRRHRTFCRRGGPRLQDGRRPVGIRVAAARRRSFDLAAGLDDHPVDTACQPVRSSQAGLRLCQGASGRPLADSGSSSPRDTGAKAGPLAAGGERIDRQRAARAALSPAVRTFQGCLLEQGRRTQGRRARNLPVEGTGRRFRHARQRHGPCASGACLRRSGLRRTPRDRRSLFEPFRGPVALSRPAGRDIR